MNTEALISDVFNNGTQEGMNLLDLCLLCLLCLPKSFQLMPKTVASILTGTITEANIEGFIDLPKKWIQQFNPEQMDKILKNGHRSIVLQLNRFEKEFPGIVKIWKSQDICHLIVENIRSQTGMNAFFDRDILPPQFHTWLFAEIQKAGNNFSFPPDLLCSKWKESYVVVGQLVKTPGLVEKLNLNLQTVTELCSGNMSEDTIRMLKKCLKEYPKEKELRHVITDYFIATKWNNTNHQEFASVTKSIQDVFSLSSDKDHVKIKSALLAYLASTIENPHAGMLFLTKDVLRKFEGVCWERSHKGTIYYEPGKNERGEPIFLDLLLKLAPSDYVDMTLGDKYACFKFILENYEPKYQAEFMHGNPDAVIPIPPNAFSSFNILLQAVRSIRLNLDSRSLALVEELKTRGEKPRAFFLALLFNPSVNKEVLMQTLDSYLHGSKIFFERNSSHTPTPVNNALKTSGYFEIGRTGTARILLTPQDWWEYTCNGGLDALKFLGATQIQKQVLKGLTSTQQTLWDSLSGQINQLTISKMVAWAEGETQPKELLTGAPQEFGKMQQNLWERLQVELAIHFVRPEDIQKYFQGSEIRLRLQKAKIEVPKTWAPETCRAFLREKIASKFKFQCNVICDLAALVQQSENLETLNRLLQELKKNLQNDAVQVMSAWTGAVLQTIHLRVVPPSDPLSFSAGSATASCDSFGDGKNTFYNATPGCSALVLTYQPSESQEETIFAQSTVMSNKMGFQTAWGNFIADVRSGRNLSAEPMHYYFGTGFLEQWMIASEAICIDNVEGNKGLVEKFLQYNDAFITELYREIGEAISKQHGGVRVLVGLGYNDYVKGLPSMRNPSIPVQAPIYTDAANVSLLVPEKPQYQEFLAKRNEALKSTVAPLTAEWILPVSYIQEEAYRGATRLTESLPEIQNTIIAAQIANQIYGQKILKQDLSLSSIAFDDKGNPAGYLIAYPARSEYNKPGVLKKGDPVIYVHDIAVREKYIGSGRFASRLLVTLMEKWALLGNIPILGDVRESTSYPMLKRAEKLGYIQLTELQKDGDTTKVLIRKGSHRKS